MIRFTIFNTLKKYIEIFKFLILLSYEELEAVNDLDLEKKIELICRPPTEEVVTPEDLRATFGDRRASYSLQRLGTVGFGAFGNRRYLRLQNEGFR